MSSTTGSAGTYERSMPTPTGLSSVTPASDAIWSGRLKQDILQAGGTWPPAGTRTTSGHSATAATSPTKGSNGFLADTSIVSDREKLKRLCSGLRAASETNWARCVRPLSITGRQQTTIPQQRVLRSGKTQVVPHSVARDAAQKDVDVLKAALKEAMKYKNIKWMTKVERMRLKRWKLLTDNATSEWQDSNQCHRYMRDLWLINDKLYRATGDEVYDPNRHYEM